MGAPPGTARRAEPPDESRRVGVYRPRRSRASPLYRLLDDRFAELTRVYGERFVHRYGYWRPVIAEAVEKYLACGILSEPSTNAPGPYDASSAAARIRLWVAKTPSAARRLRFTIRDPSPGPNQLMRDAAFSRERSSLLLSAGTAIRHQPRTLSPIDSYSVPPDDTSMYMRATDSSAIWHSFTSGMTPTTSMYGKPSDHMRMRGPSAGSPEKVVSMRPE